VSPRKAFPGYDDPIKLDGEFEDVVKDLLATTPPAEDAVEPVLDE